MKANWEYKKLSDVCDYPNQRIAIANLAIGDYVGVEHLVKNRGGLVRATQMPDAENAIEFCVDDVLIGNIRPYLRKIWLANFRGGASGDVVVIRVKKEFSDKIMPIYLYKVLSSEKFFEYDNNNTKGAKMPRGDRKAIAKYLIPIPPLSEQKRIVAELDLLTEVVDKQKAQLKELDTLAQSIFYDMFGDPIENPKGWDVKKISDVATVKIGPFGSLLHAKDYVNGGHPVINPIHLNLGKIFADESFTVDDAMYEQMQAYKLQLNDVVFGRRGDIGRCALVEKGQEGYLCGTGSLFVRFNEIINPTFSIAALMHESITDYLVKKAKGATMLNINCGIVEDIPIILPPLALQQSFADKIQSIENQKAKINQSIAETQKLLDYTMDKYFG